MTGEGCGCGFCNGNGGLVVHERDDGGECADDGSGGGAKVVGLSQIAFVALCFRLGDGVGRAAPGDSQSGGCVQGVAGCCVALQGGSLCISPVCVVDEVVFLRGDGVALRAVMSDAVPPAL